MAPGRHSFVVPVSAGHHAISPGIAVVTGDARLVGSEPASGGWRFTVENTEPSQATLSVRELGDSTLPVWVGCRYVDADIRYETP